MRVKVTRRSPFLPLGGRLLSACHGAFLRGFNRGPHTPRCLADAALPWYSGSPEIKYGVVPCMVKQDALYALLPQASKFNALLVCGLT